MKNIYVISGLGADERVFYKTDFGKNNVVFLKWMLPEKNESVENYSLRLSKKIIHKDPVIIGLSFGGMMAMEVAKHINTEKIILISSAKTRYELPLFYRAAGKLNLQKIIPFFFLLRANVFSNWAFSNRTLDDKKMLDTMMRETDIVFLKWAINKILHWPSIQTYLNTGCYDWINTPFFTKILFQVLRKLENHIGILRHITNLHGVDDLPNVNFLGNVFQFPSCVKLHINFFRQNFHSPRKEGSLTSPCNVFRNQ
jgi:pimeloyl-ACP methyl ester carboxylesterase